MAGNRKSSTVQSPPSEVNAGDLCKCGKPIVHLNANEDSAEWICRVPVFDAPRSQAQIVVDRVDALTSSKRRHFDNMMLGWMTGNAADCARLSQWLDNLERA